MPLEIAPKTTSYVIALRNKSHVRGRVRTYFLNKEREMRATENDGIYHWIPLEQTLKVAMDKIISAIAIYLIVLNQGNPHGTSLSHHRDIRIQFSYFQFIGLAIDGSLRGYYTDMA